MDTKVGKAVGVRGGGGGMNWETGIDMYTLMCIKWMTNKNLLYKKINKIKLKKKKHRLWNWTELISNIVSATCELGPVSCLSKPQFPHL